MAETTVTRMRRPPDAAYKVINPLIGLLLRSPLHGPLGKRLLLLEFTGRKSGKRFRLPVAYVRVGNELLLATQSRWKANFRDGAPVRVWLGGQHLPAFAELIADEAEVADALGRMARAAGLRPDRRGRRGAGRGARAGRSRARDRGRLRGHPRHPARLSGRGQAGAVRVWAVRGARWRGRSW